MLRSTLIWELALVHLQLVDFSGGLSYAYGFKFDPSTINFSSTTTPPTGIGESFAGVTYTPHKDVGLGINAGMHFNLVGQETLFNGSLQFAIKFYKGGGVKDASLIGLGQLLKSPGGVPLNNVPPQNSGLNSKPPISARWLVMSILITVMTMMPEKFSRRSRYLLRCWTNIWRRSEQEICYGGDAFCSRSMVCKNRQL